MKAKYKKQVYLGFNEKGKQINKWFYADTKSDLKRKIEDYKAQLKKLPNMSDITFEEYSKSWFQISKGTKSKQTQDAVKVHLRKCEALNPFPIRKVTRSQCQAIVNESWNHPHSAKGVADILRQIFQMAQNDGIIASNIALNLDRPKIAPAKHTLLSEGELEAVKRADLNDPDRLLVTVLQTFGLRPAEALALQTGDFDLNKKILHITKSLEMTNDNHSQIKSTKTGEVRDIPIPDALIPYFKKQIRRNTGFLLFEKSTGGLHTKSSYKRMQKRIWSRINEALGGDDKINLVAGRTFYDFRHRRATDLYYLCQKGIISTKQAAALLGHSEVIFLQTYSHIDESKEMLTGIYPDIAQPAL